MRSAFSRTELKEKIALSLNETWRIGVVYAAFYPEETQALVDSAVKALEAMGLPDSSIALYPAPGSFEVPLIGAALAKKEQVDALIGIGIIVEGETHHAELLAREAARGMMDVQTRYGVPFAFELLYVNDLEQARARADKGEEAALAALHSLAQLKAIRR